MQDFWEYNPSTNIWTQKANFIGMANSGIPTFSIGTKGYFGPGQDYGSLNIDTQDFWEYNSATNVWTQKADFGGGLREFAVGFSIGNKGYIGTGSHIQTGNNWATYYQDFWEYDPSTNIWTQKADFPGVGRAVAVGFSIGNKGYIGTGLDQTLNKRKDFWEYNPSTNIWTQRADFGGGLRYYAVGFSA